MGVIHTTANPTGEVYLFFICVAASFVIPAIIKAFWKDD